MSKSIFKKSIKKPIKKIIYKSSLTKKNLGIKKKSSIIRLSKKINKKKKKKTQIGSGRQFKKRTIGPRPLNTSK